MCITPHQGFFSLRRGEFFFPTLHGFGAEVLKKNRPLVIFEDFVLCRGKSSIWIDFSKGICQAKILISIFFRAARAVTKECYFCIKAEWFYGVTELIRRKT